MQRYLFAMARFNENAIKKPVLEPLPPLPDENAAPAAAPDSQADDANTPVEEEEEEEETPETATSDPEASSLQRAGFPE